MSSIIAWPRAQGLRLGAVSVLAAIAIAGCGGSDSSPGFVVDLPKQWSERDSDFGQAAGQAGAVRLQQAGLPSGGLEPLEVFTRTPAGAGDRTTANVTVFAEAMPSGETLRSVVDGGAAAVGPILGAQITAPPQPGRLGGEEAFSFAYEAKVDRSRLQFLIVQSLRQDKVYSVTLTGPANQAAKVQREFLAILKSWQWSD